MFHFFICSHSVCGLNVVPSASKIADKINLQSGTLSFSIIFDIYNRNSPNVYIKSTYRMGTEEKVKQERASLLKVDDSFKKIIVIGEECPVTRDEQGITTISVYDFLLNENSLEL